MLGKASPELLAGRVGRWRWPWLLLGHVTAIAVFIALCLPVVFFEKWFSKTSGRSLLTTTLLSSDRPETFLLFLFVAVALIVPTAIVIKLVHGQKLRAALGPDGRFSWPNFVKAAAAVFLIFAIFCIVEVIRYPDRFTYRGYGIYHAPWLLLGAMTILLVAFAEDLFFKGYLLRSWGAVLPIRSVIVLLAAGTFSSAHVLNPDVKAHPWVGLLYLFAADTVAIGIYLRTGSLAAVTGMHWMNNLCSMTFVQPGPWNDNLLAMFSYNDPILAAGKIHLAILESLFVLIIGLAMLWVLLTWRKSPLCLPMANRPSTN